MKILLLTPSKIMCGNYVDVCRIGSSLKSKGIDYVISTPTELSEDLELVKKLNIDIIHCFHSYKTRIILEIYKLYKIPYVVSMTGTDYNQYIYRDKEQKVIEKVLETSQKIFFLHPKSIDRVCSIFPRFKPKCVVLQRNVVCLLGPQEKIDLKKDIGIPSDKFVFTLIAGIRPIKNVLFPIEPLRKLNEMTDSKTVLLLVGPVIDKKYFESNIKSAIEKYDCVYHRDHVPRKHMGSLYNQSDVVLNTSLSEGGSLCILEAFSSGVPVLGNDIEGNRAWISKDMVNGVIYKFNDESDFIKKAKMLYEEEDLRNKLKSNGIKRVNEFDSGRSEVDVLINVYKKIA